ncbi:MAG: protease pro-enzyme activation domain-containing protein [Bryobacteraceae bacterium]
MTARSMQSRRIRLAFGSLLALILALPHALGAADRITATIDNSRRATLTGHVSPRIASGVDQGRVGPSMQLPYVTLVLKPSASQETDLERLLAQQQDRSSPNYHVWLTPEQYADRFGLSQADIDKIVGWLGQYGLSVKSVARGRNSIAFGGTAGQVGNAFGVEIHRFQVGGALHYANSADPTIPAAFQDVVLALRGLHDFRWKPKLRPAAHPRDTMGGTHELAPDDIATIYDITPLYNNGIDGSGQSLVIVGQTDIYMTDIEYYRNYFNLPVNDPSTLLVPGTQDPGLQIESGDLAEADLDLELSGSVARKANIQFVYSEYVQDALQYAVDEDLAPVISTSYGDCEADTGSPLSLQLQQVAMQANSQGQTIFAAAGDYGTTDCFGDGDGAAIDNSRAVDLPASIPQVTGVGGTEFSDLSGNYWNSTNTSNHASARSYIPEVVWNDSTAEGEPAAGGGGVSIFFTKPTWQTGTGVPNDGFRDVPDVSLSASNYHDVYDIYTDQTFAGYGGTSAGGPQFAGIAALLSQYLVSNSYQSNPHLGNINQTLYELGPVGGVFHDITLGNNTVVPCYMPCSTPETVGYSAGTGYDQVTGWGTPDVYNLVTAWHTHALSGPQTVTMGLTANPSSVAFTGGASTAVLTATVTSTNGATPTGTITFSVGGSPLGTATLSGSGASASATLTFSAVQLAVGSNTITASYSGDANYYGQAATASVDETTPSNGTPSVGGVLNAASYTAAFAPGGLLSVFGTQLAPADAGAPGTPWPTMLAGTSVMINGIPAPLYYVSPGRLNIQIPYELSYGSPQSLATLIVDNNGLVNYYSFYIATAAAPAIFTTNSQGTGQGSILDNSTYELVDASHPATAGSTYIQIYCMGLGAVTNQPADGAAAPFSPYAETSTEAQVTIGGVQENAIFTGLAPGFVGLYQVNALVPMGVTTTGGNANVVISLGGVTSNQVTIAVGP